MEQSFLIRGDFIFSDREGKLKELPDSVLLVKDGIVCGGFSADELPDDFEKLAAIAGQEVNSLVLITCENESAEGGYLHRRAVFARPL